MKQLPEDCPFCEAPLATDEVIGIEVLGLYDGVAYWYHRDCKHQWCRFCGKLDHVHSSGCFIGEREFSDEE